MNNVTNHVYYVDVEDFFNGPWASNAVIAQPARDGIRAERVAEPRVLGAGVDQPRPAHLLDPAQPLHRAGVEHGGEIAVAGLELDQAVDRIARREPDHGGDFRPHAAVQRLRLNHPVNPEHRHSWETA